MSFLDSSCSPFPNRHDAVARSMWTSGRLTPGLQLPFFLLTVQHTDSGVNYLNGGIARRLQSPERLGGLSATAPV
jgi:hypothetical protein